MRRVDPLDSDPRPLWPSHELDLVLARARHVRAARYFASIGSTNDEAKRMAEAGEAEGLLLIADEQTAGRGRLGRQWSTPAGRAIAMSLVLRPRLPASRIGALTMLGGLAVARALELELGLLPQLKWPNDALLSGKKVAGILVEAAWSGEGLDFAVLGIGINVLRGSHPPPAEALFPATSVEAEAGRAIGRAGLLAAVVAQIDEWYPRLESSELRDAWSERLAFKGQSVRVSTPTGEVTGKELGVDVTGALILETEGGKTTRVMAGDVRLRPIPPRI